MGSRISIAEYPESEIPEQYFDYRSNERMCVTCSHFTARCDLRREKRCIVPLEHGRCSLRKELRTLGRYERIPELRAVNMNPLERFYHHMYTKKYLQKVLKWFFHDSKLVFIPSKNTRFAEDWADMIATYEKHSRNKEKNETDRT